MWDLRVANPFGKLSLRNLTIFVAAIVATSFAFNLLFTHTTHAADAQWNNDSIVYDGHAYDKALSEDDSKRGGLPDGTVYVYKESVNGDQPNVTQKAYVIYFAPGSDPGGATKAQYATYDFTPPNTYKNKSGVKEVAIEKKSDKKGSSCVVPGIGWIICPVSSFMSSAMDWMYTILAQFLEVQPAATSTESSLFLAWSIMRNVANVAFVIAFLVIIYSQVSNIGISNYGIKKLLPRLVIAAVLVNISYWICAVAIDISNILGYSMKDLFSALNKAVVATGNNSDISWENVTATVLSGGTLGAIGILAVGSVTGAVYLLLPMLVGLILSALVAIVIMAARQAIIVILVIVSPLAFVAYLLPNTEKYFEKWKDLLITMLMLFPIFGVLFGGSELAGTAIIQNATSFIMILLGMAVKIAPLAIMPFVIKFGGSLLGRIGGMVNNPNKGLVDRTRNFSNSMAESKRQKNLARPNATLRRNGLSRTLQALDSGRRKREGQQKVHETMSDARWENSQAAHGVHAAAARATLLKDIAHQNAEAHVEGLKRTDAEMQSLDTHARASKLNLDLTQAKVETNWEQFRAGDARGMVTPEDLSVRALAEYAQQQNNLAQHVKQMSVDTAATDLRKDAAKRQQTTDVSDSLLQNTMQIEGQKVLEYAGGIQGGTGREAALSKAVTSYRKQLHEAIENNHQLMNHFNISMQDKQALALGGEITGKRPDGTTFTFSPDVVPAREAAIEEILKKGSYGDIDKIILESGTGSTKDYADTISRLIKEAGVDKKALYWGSKVIGEIEQGNISGPAGREQAIIHHIEGGKITAENVAGMDAKALQYMFNIAQQPSAYAAKSVNPNDFMRNAQQLHDTVDEIMKTDLLKSKSTEKARQNMRYFLDGNIVPDDPS